MSRITPTNKHRLLWTKPALVLGAVLAASLASIAPPPATGKVTRIALPAAPDEVALVRQRLRASLLVDALPPNALAEAAAHLATLRPDGSWPDQDYADTNREQWKAADHLPRLLALARAYYQPGSPLAGRADVQAKLLAGLAYWLHANPRNANWWHQSIGVPKQVGELLLLLGDEAPSALRTQGLAVLAHSNTKGMTGQNLVWTAQVTIMRGCLTPDPALVQATFERLWQEVRYAKAGEEGIQVDASFHQHGPLLYAGGYGQGFTADVVRFVGCAAGTRFALPAAQQAILTAYVLDGQQWMGRGGQWDFGVTGRELIRPGKSAAGLRQPVAGLAALPGPRQPELTAFAARLHARPNAPALTGNRHYWLSDYMAQQRPGYLASTRMYSARTLNTDAFLNGENKTSHHLADGATCLLLTGQEYVGIYPVWDWHRIPGTTVEQNTPLEPGRVSHRGTTRFVGGVSDGRYGAAAQDLASDSLRACKAWFYFDDEIVCLGAGINCPTPNLVFTSLNQTLRTGPVRTSLAPAADLPAGDHDLAPATWVWHGNIGYVFPTATAAHLRNAPQTGSLRVAGPGSPNPITKNVFSLWLNHGPAPQGRTYAYVLLPATSAAHTAAVAAHLPVEIASNTPQLQAVRHRKLGLLAAAFRTPGQARSGPLTVTVDAPCLLLVQQRGPRVRLSVANPLNEPALVRVGLNLPLTGADVRRVGPNQSEVLVTLPGGLAAGSSVVRELTVRQ